MRRRGFCRRLWCRWALRRPTLTRRDRVALCVEEIRAAEHLTRAQRDAIVARWSLPGNIRDWASVAVAVRKRLGHLVDPAPRRHA